MSNLETIFLVVEGIDRRTKHHTDLLEVIANSTKSSGDSMEKIASHTEDMAGGFRELMKENRENIQLIAGKKQVPLGIFLIVLLVVSGYLFLDKLTKGVTLRVSPSGGLEFHNAYETTPTNKSP